MKYTNNLNLKKPDQVDFYDVDDFNFNADELDKKIAEILNAIIIASQNEAETGTDNVRMMSPLRVKQAILKLAPKPAIASQAEAEAGTDNAKHMTPLRTKQAIEAFDNTPVGDVAFRPFLKAGYVKANGATVNRADYPRLVAFANANNLWTTNPANEPWKFGQGNGSTTMVLPNYVGRFIQGGDTTGTKQAGLPNITGEIGDFHTNNIIEKGAFKFSRESRLERGGASGKEVYICMSFDASRCSNIYGASTTVQPLTVVLIPQLRY